MKKVALTLVITIALAAIGSKAMANATVSLYDSDGTTGGGEFIAIASGLDFEPVSLGDNGFETFCVEMDEHIRFGKIYDVKISEEAIAGGVGGGSPDPLDPRTAYLYTEFISGSLIGYDYSGSGRTNSANALQYAIWFIEDETTALPNAQAQAFYDAASNAVDNGDWQGTGTVHVMNLYRWEFNKQDQLVMAPCPTGDTQVPAPGAVLLASIGAALVVGRLRRRRTL